MPYTLIDKQPDFDALCVKLASHKYLSIDTESNSLYAYKEKFCLLQLTSEHINAIVDTLAVDIRPILPIFADPAIEKIFHSADSDIRVFKGALACRFENIFDVMVAAKYLGIVKCGLDNMVKEYIGVEMNKKFQKADWGRRPLSREMLDYAINDTVHLKKLRDLLARQLEEKGRLQEAMTQFAQISQIEPRPMHFDENGFLTMRGARQLNGRGLAVLRELFLAREVTAIKSNTPPFKIISEDLMLRLAVAPREGIVNLSIFKGVSSYVLAHHGPWIHDALHKGMKAPEYHVPRRELSREKRIYLEAIRDRFKALKVWRKNAAIKRNMLPEAILSNDVMERIAFSQPRSLADLQAIKGLGQEKFALYGPELVEFFLNHRV
ncbi:MAG TPA: HRDC domain-containing protein [Elusimicrobiales bacterium]|nr:HRDC domain-containing protein [Elusimicrobiales bacterium]